MSKFFDTLSLDTHDSHISAAIIVAINAIMATPLTLRVIFDERKTTFFSCHHDFTCLTMVHCMKGTRDHTVEHLVIFSGPPPQKSL